MTRHLIGIGVTVAMIFSAGLAFAQKSPPPPPPPPPTCASQGGTVVLTCVPQDPTCVAYKGTSGCPVSCTETCVLPAPPPAPPPPAPLK